MNMEIHDGFTLYKKRYGPVWAALHSGPAIRKTSRDDSSDIISSLCWRKTGGTLLFSTFTRDMLYGIDFNRELPESEIAVNMCPKFEKGRMTEEKRKYKKQYAFVCQTKKEYNEKKRIYKSLWSYVRNSGDFIIFMHRQYARLKNYPSAMDLITFNSCGIKKEILDRIVEEINASNRDFFRKIEKNFKNVTYIEQIRQTNVLGMRKDYFRDDLRVIQHNCSKATIDKLRNDFSQENFLAASAEALKKLPPPEITLEKIFSAESAIGPKKEIIKNSNKMAIEIEVNCFMSEWYPKETSKMVLEIVEKIKRVEEYKKMGFTQPQILKFL